MWREPFPPVKWAGIVPIDFQQSEREKHPPADRRAYSRLIDRLQACLDGWLGGVGLQLKLGDLIPGFERNMLGEAWDLTERLIVAVSGILRDPQGPPKADIVQHQLDGTDSRELTATSLVSLVKQKVSARYSRGPRPEAWDAPSMFLLWQRRQC